MKIWVVALSLLTVTLAENQTLISQTRTSYLEDYRSYADVVLMHFDVPEDVAIVSFQFRAGEMSYSIFSCTAKEILVYLQVGALPVINPDGSKIPDNFYLRDRFKKYDLSFMSNERAFHYVNLTSPKPGSYYAVAFHPYVNPKDQGITQDGLLPQCNIYLDANVYIELHENIDIIVPDMEVKMVVRVDENQIFKLYVPSNVSHVLVHFKDILFCDTCTKLQSSFYFDNDSSNSSSKFNVLKSSNYKKITAKYSIIRNNFYYLKFTIDNNGEAIDILGKFNFEVTYVYYVAKNIKSAKNSSVSYFNAIQKTYFDNSRMLDLPYKQYDLHKSKSSESFLYTYEMQPLQNGSVPIAIHVNTEETSVLNFNIRDVLDVGGSIQLILAFKPRIEKVGRYIHIHQEPSDHKIIACLRNGDFEIPTFNGECKYNDIYASSILAINSTHDNDSLVIPYPDPGNWYFSFKLFCENCEACNCSESCRQEIQNCTVHCEASCNGSECDNCMKSCEGYTIDKSECKNCDCIGNCKKEVCNSTILFDISSFPCVSQGCGSNGKCVYLVSEAYIYSSCVCSNNYRGWDCLDDSQANSMGAIILELILLVLSNLMFIPAAYIAYKRQCYVEMVVYSFTCLCSILYHSCDAGENIISFCITRIYVLQYCDFYCALLSIWVTLISMAHLAAPLPQVFHIGGAILLGAGTTLDKTSIWVFLLPVSVGVVIIIASWGFKYYKTKTLFPSRRYLKIILPCGLVIVLIALLMYSLLQTNSNYKYVHSLWHILMAVSVIILLPDMKTFLPNISYNL